MPVSKEIREILEQAPKKEVYEDYIEKLPTLNPEDFPDETRLADLHGRGLRRILRQAELHKGAIGGVTRILKTTQIIGDYENRIDVTLGDIRGLSFEQLVNLREHFWYGTPTPQSLLVLKKLCGPKEKKSLLPSTFRRKDK